MWFENGTYIGHLPPGTFSEGEALTQQRIRRALLKHGYRDPQFDLPQQTIKQAIQSVTGKNPPIYSPWGCATATACGGPAGTSGSWSISSNYGLIYSDDYKSVLDRIVKHKK